MVSSKSALTTCNIRINLDEKKDSIIINPTTTTTTTTTTTLPTFFNNPQTQPLILPTTHPQRKQKSFNEQRRKHHKNKRFQICILIMLSFITPFLLKLLLMYITFATYHRSPCSTPPHSPDDNNKSHNIAVVTVWDDRNKDKRFKGMNNNDITPRSIRNKQQYASKHGYDFVSARQDRIDKVRGGSWSKIKVLSEEFQQSKEKDYDWLFYVDLDVVIMNMDIRLEDYINEAKEEEDIIMIQDWNGPNFGVFMIRNSDWSRRFLQELWSLDFLVQCSDCPYNYEQRALHYVLDTTTWRQSGAGKRLEPWEERHSEDGGLLSTTTTEEVWKHFKFVPQCAMNSYKVVYYSGFMGMLKNLYMAGCDFKGGTIETYLESEYEDGDFLVHAAGYKGEGKVRVMIPMLDEAERRFGVYNETVIG